MEVRKSQGCEKVMNSNCDIFLNLFSGHIVDEFSCRELGSVPLSASISKGTGVWVARGDLPILYLYHAHTKQLLQTFDLSHRYCTTCFDTLQSVLVRLQSKQVTPLACLI